MADVGKDPFLNLKKVLKFQKIIKMLKYLWASTREPYNYFKQNKLGVI